MTFSICEGKRVTLWYSTKHWMLCMEWPRSFCKKYECDRLHDRAEFVSVILLNQLLSDRCTVMIFYYLVFLKQNMFPFYTFITWTWYDMIYCALFTQFKSWNSLPCMIRFTITLKNLARSLRDGMTRSRSTERLVWPCIIRAFPRLEFNLKRKVVEVIKSP